MQDLKSIIGLFIPVKWDKKLENGDVVTVWQGSIEVAGLPLGFIMVLVAIVVNLIMK